MGAPTEPTDCVDCGEPATHSFDEGADYAFWTGLPRFVPVCGDCWTIRDNREPSEPDGECYRGREAEYAMRDAMIAAQKVK